MTKKHSPIIAATVIIIAIALFSDTGICIFRRITGIPCPSCGMTRAYLALFSGDIKSAFFMHPLFWIMPIIVGLIIYSHNKKINFTKTYVVIGIIFIIVYIIRLILFFPHTYPFNYEHASLLGRLIFH